MTNVIQRNRSSTDNISSSLSPSRRSSWSWPWSSSSAVARGVIWIVAVLLLLAVVGFTLPEVVVQQYGGGDGRILLLQHRLLDDLSVALLVQTKKWRFSFSSIIQNNNGMKKSAGTTTTTTTKRSSGKKNTLMAAGRGSFCGTYRGYPYVGFRCQSVDSPVMGLMWYSPSTIDSSSSSSSSSSSNVPLSSRLRHEANHDDALTKFGWNEHDGNGYGTQLLSDPNNNVNLTVQWIRLVEEDNQDDDEEGGDGIEGHWVVRISGDVYQSSSSNDATEIGNVSKNDLSLIWYVATPGANLTATYHIKNETIHVGNNFRSWMDESSNNNTYPTYSDGGDDQSQKQHYNGTYFAAFQTNSHSYFDVKSTVVQELRNPTSTLPPHLFDPTSLYRAETITTGNQVTIQSFFQTPFQVDYHFEFISPSASPGSSLTSTPSSIEVSKNNITNVSEALLQASDDFRQKFNDIFVSDDAVSRRRRNHNGTSSYKWSDRELETGYYALGNLLSSITYMYGDQQIYDAKTDRVIVPNDMKDLVGVMVVPDRPDHAQGFLWDDGFHQQLLRHWDVQWSINILKSWYEKAVRRPPDDGDDDGWIPRQQIIGDEARWSARPTSWAQIQGTANPPTHHWVLESLLESTANTSVVDVFLKDISSSFERNLKFYLRTQTSSIPGFFAWKGKTRDFCLPSGMDDYPRSSIDNGNHEAHLDLHTWLIVSCRVATKVFDRLNDTDKAQYYDEMRSNLTGTLFTHFWDKSRNVFDDWYYITSESDNTTEKVFSGHIGYLNWFPVFLGVLPTDTPIFGKAISSLLDKKNGVWAKYGLRSLSINDPAFGVTAKYWTGPVWLNINYLAVSSLYNYHQDSSLPMPAPVREKIQVGYHELRQSLVNMVVDSYESTGFIWETYNGTDGKGLNNHPFTGWSALIVNIMAELY